MRMPVWQRGLIALLAVAVTCALFINYCNLVYQCGCTYLWAGGADHCNIHHGPKHCPWCQLGTNGQMLVWLSMVVPQAIVSFWLGPQGFLKRLIAALLTFPIAGLVPAIGLGLWKGYWN